VEATKEDQSLQKLMKIIKDGWPNARKGLPREVRPYYNFRDELVVQDELVMKGDRVVVPAQQQQQMIESLHSSHFGIESCLRRARECLYWPNMNSQVQQYIEKCSVCMSMADKQQKETMISHEIPNQPWSKVGTDLFQLDGRTYLITVDYYSKFWEIDYIDNSESITVIKKL
jgi:hypothetical protein